MERELDDEFEVDGVVLRVVEASNTFSCDGCYFLESEQNVCGFQNCLKCERGDNKSVKFVKRKIGPRLVTIKYMRLLKICRHN